ncbi:hypothetical protein [Sphingobacterium sp.]|uniref:hypothetical protein n=1 Tax=Sphingobacterium sp. TaxID=341027 RepID=UPI002898D614|nr:hypothetical protein [Sphingobacterium sp.]
MENVVKNIENVKKKLPHGAQKEIAEKSGKTIYTVSRVLCGKSNNKEVLKAIHEYVLEMNSINNDLEQFIG